MPKTFDVFFSYNSKDRDAVRGVADAIRREGVRVFMGEDSLPLGQPWQPRVETALEEVPSAVIFLGPSRFGEWQKEEARLCLTHAVKRQIPVISVLLPGGPSPEEIRGFLGGRTCSDLRNDTDGVHLQRLIQEIRAAVAEPAFFALRSQPANPLKDHHIHLPLRPLGDLFKGRTDDLRILETNLHRLRPAAAIAVIYGLGGTGKTRLAVEYAWSSSDCYDAAFFVRADSPAVLWAGLAGLARLDLPGLSCPPSLLQKDEDEIAAALAWLRSHDRWLLILDNVDTHEAAAAIRDFLKQAQLLVGHVVITSRRRSWPPTYQAQSLDSMMQEEATQFLLERTEGKRAHTPEDTAQASHLARTLDGLPLALEQAAAYIACHQMKFSKYLELWEKERSSVLDWHDEDQDSPAALSATWQTTFRQLSPTAAAILRLAAYLAPDPIPLGLFENSPIIVPRVVKLFCKENRQRVHVESIREKLAELIALSMITINHDTETVIIHRVVREVLRTRTPEKRKMVWTTAALWMVTESAPPEVDARTWPAWDSARPHIEEVLQSGYVSLVPKSGPRLFALRMWSRFMNRLQVALPTAQLAIRFGSYLVEKGAYSQAEPLIRRFLDIEQRIHPESFVTGEHLNNLGFLLEKTDRRSEAEPLLRRALEIEENVFGNDSPMVASCLNNLATLLQATNRMAEAEPLLRRALRIAVDSFGEDHPRATIYLNNLAQLLQVTNRLAEVEPLMRRVVEIQETNLGADHPQFASSINNLAQLLQAKNRLAEAEPLMRRALKIDEEFFGNDHPDVARDLINLAGLLQKMNRLAEAEPMMRQGLDILKIRLGSNHSKVATALSNLAQLLQEMNHLAEAELLMRRALKIDEEAWGRDHPNAAIGLLNLAGLLRYTSRLAEAEPLAERGIEILEAGLGPDHPNVATALTTLAALLWDTNRWAKAEQAIRRSLKIRENSFGSNHPDVAAALNMLAQLLQATNRMAEAEPLMRRALKIREDSFGSDHPAVATSFRDLAGFLYATGRIEESEPLMRHALKICEASFGRNHPRVAIALNNLAQLLQATNRMSEAEPMMERALKIYEDSFGSNHPEVATTLNNLALLLQATNRMIEAEPFMRRALKIYEDSFGSNHPNRAMTLNNLALLLKAMGRLAEAEPLIRQAVEIYRASLGLDHPTTKTIEENLDALLAAKGDGGPQLLESDT